MRGTSGRSSVEFEGDRIILDDGIGPDDLLVPDQGRRKIGVHEGCGGRVIAAMEDEGLAVSCERVMCCHLDVRDIPPSAGTPSRLRVFLADISYLPRPMGAR